MPVVKFTLSEEGVNVLRDSLACLSKFSDEVSLDAKRDQVSPYVHSLFGFRACIALLTMYNLPLYSWS